jgi:hypothetical protein
MEVVERITIADVRAARPKMIYYGARTCWWTHDPNHLCNTGQQKANVVGAGGTIRQVVSKQGLPCDPRGGVLFQTDDIEGFLRAAEEHAEAYGRHGLRAFMAAHHENCQVSLTDDRRTCGVEWADYNDALDRLDARQGEQQ